MNFQSPVNGFRWILGDIVLSEITVFTNGASMQHTNHARIFKTLKITFVCFFKKGAWKMPLRSPPEEQSSLAKSKDPGEHLLA